MKSFVVAAATIAIFATPALAQKGMHGGKGRGDQQQQQTSEEKKKAALKLEKDYKAALDGIPDKKYDQWGGVRPPGNPK